MNIIQSILRDFKRFFSFKTKVGRIRVILLLISLGVAVVLLRGISTAEVESLVKVRSVETASVSSFLDGSSIQLIGTVSAISRAAMRSEASGRVTRVSVSLGDTVVAGQVLLQLENASEQASVLQAEGAYEAALAAAAVSDVSVMEAQNNVKIAENNAYASYELARSVLSDVYYNDLDAIFADPDSTYRTPGLSLQKTRDILYDLDNRFDDLDEILTLWFPESLSAKESVEVAQVPTASMLEIVNIFRSLINDAEIGSVYDSTESEYLRTLSVSQTKLNTVLANLRAAEVQLVSADAVLQKAQLGGTSVAVSSANAQVKQALGVLRAAQANYNKTIIRTPIAGVVNSLPVQRGDFITAFQHVAEIANNNALEVTTYIGQSERELVSVQQEVLIEGSVTGVVTAIAPAVDSSTGKIEVKIQSTSKDLVNGDTVVIALKNVTTTNKNTSMQVPLTAVKFTTNAGSVFTIEEDTLVAHAVEIGSVRDTYIEIVSGVTPDLKIVVDVRGLTEGQKVSVLTTK